MARHAHYYTGDKTTGCCDKTVASLGLGAVLTDDPAEVTCPKMTPADEGREVNLDLDNLRPGEHACCGGPHTAQASNPLGHSVGCENYGAGAGEGRNWFGPPEQLPGTAVEGLKQREGDQQLPVPNDEPDIQSQVIADIVERREVGIQRYGTALQPWNGRDPVRDLYEELLDGAMYAKQILVERAHLVNRIAELEIEVATRRAHEARLHRAYLKAQGIPDEDIPA